MPIMPDITGRLCFMYKFDILLFMQINIFFKCDNKSVLDLFVSFTGLCLLP